MECGNKGFHPGKYTVILFFLSYFWMVILNLPSSFLFLSFLLLLLLYSTSSPITTTTYTPTQQPPHLQLPSCRSSCLCVRHPPSQQQHPFKVSQPLHLVQSSAHVVLSLVGGNVSLVALAVCRSASGFSFFSFFRLSSFFVSPDYYYCSCCFFSFLSSSSPSPSSSSSMPL